MFAFLGALWLTAAPSGTPASSVRLGSLPSGTSAGVAVLRVAQAARQPAAGNDLPSGRDRVDRFGQKQCDDRTAERQASGAAELALFHDPLALPTWSSRLLADDLTRILPARRLSRKAGEIPSPRGPPLVG